MFFLLSETTTAKRELYIVLYIELYIELYIVLYIELYIDFVMFCYVLLLSAVVPSAEFGRFAGHHLGILIYLTSAT